MAGIRVVGTCKGDALSYVVLVSDESLGAYALSCRTSDGSVVPVTAHPIALDVQRAQIPGTDELPYAWVAAIPALAVEATLCISHGETSVAEVPIRSTRPAAPPQGRVGRLVHHLASRAEAEPPYASFVRRIECRDWTGRTRVTVTEIWPAGEAVVWRVQVVYATADGQAKPQLTALDENARPIDAKPIVMEDHVVPAGFDTMLRERFVTFSLRLPREREHAVLVASLEGVSDSQGFTCMVPEAVRQLRADCEGRLADVAGDPGYERWFDVHRVTARDLEQQREAARALGEAAPTFGVVLVDTSDVGAHAAEDSLAGQCYEHHELVTVRTAGGEGLAAALASAIQSLDACDYLVFLDAADELEPDALWRLAEEVVRHPETDLIYADEDHLHDGHYVAPDFKTFPNLGKLRAYDYLGDLLCVSRTLLDRAGLPEVGVEAAWHYDLALRAFEQAKHPAHVPCVLCHVGEHGLPGYHEAGRQALQWHLERSGTEATVEDGPTPWTYRVRYTLPDPAPLVSIVIPSKDHASLLRACVSSILERSTYPRYEIVVVENNSTEPETFALYSELRASDPRVRVVTWKPTGKTENGFNYSAIVNCGARAARGEHIVFLNNDTQVIAPGWLEEMVGCLTRPEVAVVGAKLLFEDGLVQHAGMVANPNCDNAHVNQNLWRDTGGYDFSATLPTDMNMVTGACQMVRRSVLDELGGYDENLAVGFNDSEFCLRVRSAGYAVAFTPYALLYHREFSSRGREVYDVRMRQRLLTEKAYVMAKYPAYYARGDESINENLDRFSLYFKLRW